ncbi:MAG TPA: hypothetical protein VLH84_01715 [Patescibacteria group bacterium]|nr:hypothetical protein [Patescibacteria group bacterium]
MNTVSPLEGVKLLAPTLLEGVARSRMTSMLDDQDEINRQLAGEVLIPHAQRLGAVILNDRNGHFNPALLDDPDTFTLFSSQDSVEASDRAIRSGVFDDGLTRPGAIHIEDCADNDFLRRPYVFSAVHLQGGTGKYLIESVRQARRVRQAYRDGKLGDEECELREFISTPSDRYTSYRVVLGPTGEALAAGLIYSGHTKAFWRPKRIQTQARPSLGRTLASFEDRRRVCAAFEYPDSPYFLDAKDVRSNMAQGGDCIPLMGDNRRPISDIERRILRAHDIDPDRPALPEGIWRQLPTVSRAIGKGCGLGAGADFVQHATDGRYPLLEVNHGIELGTYRACWSGGDRSEKDYQSNIALGMRMFDAIAKTRQHA